MLCFSQKSKRRASPLKTQSHWARITQEKKLNLNWFVPTYLSDLATNNYELFILLVRLRKAKKKSFLDDLVKRFVENSICSKVALFYLRFINKQLDKWLMKVQMNKEHIFGLNYFYGKLFTNKLYFTVMEMIFYFNWNMQILIRITSALLNTHTHTHTDTHTHTYIYIYHIYIYTLYQWILIVIYQ